MTRQFVVLWLLGMVSALIGLVVYDLSWLLIDDDEEIRWYDETVGGALQALTAEAARSPDPAEFLARQRLPYPVQVRPLAALPAGVESTWEAGYYAGYDYGEEGEFLYTRLDGRQALVWGPMPSWTSARFTPRHGLTLLVVAVLMGAVLAAGLWPLARAHDALSAAARRYAAGDLDQRMTSSRWVAPELADAFDTMAGQTQERIRAHQALLHAVSHELRTPLARLRLSMHLWAGASADERAGLERSASDDLAEVDELLDELLDLARVDHESTRETVRLDRLVASVAGDDAPVDARPVWVEVEPSQLQRAVSNLVRNARQHGGGRVQVHVESDGTVHVDDDGPGLADPARLRAPFARGSASRGSGLGLAIVDRIASRHDTRLVLTASPMGGCRASIRWPVAEPPSEGTAPLPA